MKLLLLSAPMRLREIGYRRHVATGHVPVFSCIKDLSVGADDNELEFNVLYFVLRSNADKWICGLMDSSDERATEGE